MAVDLVSAVCLSAAFVWLVVTIWRRESERGAASVPLTIVQWIAGCATLLVIASVIAFWFLFRNFGP